jgi:hypothetical protein
VDPRPARDIVDEEGDIGDDGPDGSADDEPDDQADESDITSELPVPRSAELRRDAPHSSRIYDYLLGGKDNYQADRAAASILTEDLPHLATSMRANRQFMVRAARYMAAELGIRQFLDIGTGLPTSPNLHEVVQEIAPQSRVVYVDNDPVVLVHARARLPSRPEGRTAYLDADLLAPDSILSAAQLRETLDLTAPVGVSLLAVLQFVENDEDATAIVQRLMASMPPGSALAVSTVTGDSAPREVSRGAIAYRRYGIPSRARSRAEVEGLLAGLDVIDPGVVLVSHWHPDTDVENPPDDHVYMYGAVALKP